MYKPSEMSDAEYQLSIISSCLNRHCIMFSKTEAMQIVGGKKRLYRLVEQGKIRFEKPTNKQNGKWYCNAADVLRFAMP